MDRYYFNSNFVLSSCRIYYHIWHMMPAIGEGRAVSSALKFYCAKLAMQLYYHQKPYCRVAYDRIHAILLFVSFDDTNSRPKSTSWQLRPS